MFMLEGILEFGGQITSLLQQLNSWLFNNFGGLLLLIAALAALAAWRKAAKDKDAMQRLAEAIVRQYNRELRKE